MSYRKFTKNIFYGNAFNILNQFHNTSLKYDDDIIKVFLKLYFYTGYIHHPLRNNLNHV